MQKRQFLFTVLTASILSACGGSSGGDDSNNNTPNDTQSTISGKAIDGYIQGATAFLDKNYNGQLDSGEPSSLTNSTGDFSFNIDETDACLNTAPIVVQVPVGAIDSDNPNSAIDKAYTMTLPPLAFTNVSSDTRNTTPLTTEIWETVKAKAISENIEFNCVSLGVNTSKDSEWLEDAISDSEDTIMTELGVSNKTDLYSDYIVTGNTDLHNSAQEMVEDLQVFEADKSEIESQFSDKSDLRITIVSKDSDSLQEFGTFDDGEYKVTTVSYSLDSQTSKTFTVVSDLNVSFSSVYFDSMSPSPAVYASTNTFVTNGNSIYDYTSKLINESGSESCNTLEVLSNSVGVNDYKLTNKRDTSCGSIAVGYQKLESKVSVESKIDGDSEQFVYTQAFFPEEYIDNATYLENQVISNGVAETINPILTQVSAAINSDFEDAIDGSPTSWKKSYNYRKNESNIEISYDDNGHWLKTFDWDNSSTDTYQCFSVDTHSNISPEESIADYWMEEYIPRGTVWVTTEKDSLVCNNQYYFTN